MNYIPVELLEEILVHYISCEDEVNSIVMRTDAFMRVYFDKNFTGDFDIWAKPLRTFVQLEAYNQGKLELELPQAELTLPFFSRFGPKLRHLGLLGRYRGLIFEKCTRLEACYLNNQVPTIKEIETLSKLRYLKHLTLSLWNATTEVVDAVAKLALHTLTILRCNVDITSIETSQAYQLTRISPLSYQERTSSDEYRY